MDNLPEEIGLHILSFLTPKGKCDFFVLFGFCWLTTSCAQRWSPRPWSANDGGSLVLTTTVLFPRRCRLNASHLNPQ